MKSFLIMLLQDKRTAATSLSQATSDKRKAWIVWLFVLVATFTVHFSTLSISPTIWQDEVQIVEFGRVTLLEPNTDWSITWLAKESRPVKFWYYPAPALQEIAYRLTAPFPSGSRTASLIGAMIAATAAISWLLARGTPCVASFILGFVFLLDPLFVQGYRGGRVDCWALALVFAACWTVRSAGNVEPNSRAQFKLLMTLGGGLTAAAAYVWLTAVLTFPLIIAEIAVVLRQLCNAGNARKYLQVLFGSISFATGGLIVLAVFITPILPQFATIIGDASSIVALNSPPLNKTLEVAPFLQPFKLSPFLPAVALIALVFRRNRLLSVATLITVVYLLGARVYIYRVIYLLPFMLGLISNALISLFAASSSDVASSFTQRLKNSYRKIAFSSLVVLILWAAFLSLVARPITAWRQRQDRNPEIILNAARQSIGTGQVKVYMGSYDFYFAGRSLGWRMFRPLYVNPEDSVTVYPPDEQVAIEALLRQVDYAVFNGKDVNSNLIACLSSVGLNQQQTILGSSDIASTNTQRVSVSAKPYSDYVVFSRR